MAFVYHVWDLMVDLSLYLLIGAVAAGVLHRYIPTALIRRHLGGKGHAPVVKAALFGIPLPFCSCSVVPFAVSLKRSGAGDGAVVSFLISTPITGADSIVATYGVFGWVFTLYRVVSAFIVALIAGIFVNAFALPGPSFSTDTAEEKSASTSRWQDIVGVFSYGFNTVFKDIARPLAVGILLGALILTFVPQEWGASAREHTLLAYLTVLLIAPPLYICATSSIPIAASLVLIGFPVGAAFVLLSAGPATSTVTMSIIYNELGRRIFTIYLVSVVGLSLVFGLLLDRLLQSSQMDIAAIIAATGEDSLLFQAAAVVTGVLIVYYLLPRRKKPSSGSCCGDTCGCEG